MKRTSVKAFSATITIGLEKGYSQEMIPKDEIIIFLQQYQDNVINKKQIYLSASVTKCDIVLSGQTEPHLRLGFINYPKFPITHYRLKNEIEDLAKALMEEFKQERIVLEYLDETVMFERTVDIDPRIRL